MKGIITLLCVFLIAATTATALELQPNSWAQSTAPGQSLSKTFTFTTGINDSQNLTLTKGGEIYDWLTISQVTHNISGSSSASFSLTAIIPSVATGTYDGTVNYTGTSSGSISVTFFVQGTQSTSDCSLIPFPSSWRKSIQQGAETSKMIAVQVSQKCSGAVTFKNLDLVGGIVTGSDNLDRPFRIEEENLGQVLPGQELSIPIVIDAQGVETGTYDSLLSIDALTQNGTLLKTVVSLSLVVSKGVSPVTNSSFTTLPSCTLPSTNLQANQTYELTCSNTDPNVDIQVLYNEYLKGIKVEEPANQYIWRFSPTKEGDTTLVIYFTYKGSPVGEAIQKPLKITSSPVVPLGNVIRLRFFPPAEQISAGQQVAILAEDNYSGVVLSGVDLYINGVKMDNNTFTPQQGQSYIITATKSGFLTAEQTINTAKSLIAVSFQGILEEGQTFYINTNPFNTTLKVNGQVSSGGMNLSRGTYTFTAEYPDYETYNGNFTIEEALQINSVVPSRMKLDEAYMVSLTKAADWTVYFKEDNESIGYGAVVASDHTSQIVYTPDKDGIYTVFLRNNHLGTYDLTGFLSNVNWKWVAIIGGGAILLLLLISFIRSRNRAGTESGGGTEGAGAYEAEYDE